MSLDKPSIACYKNLSETMQRNQNILFHLSSELRLWAFGSIGLLVLLGTWQGVSAEEPITPRSNGPIRSGDRVDLTGTYTDISRGEEVDLGRAGKDTFVYVWTTYCVPCIRKIPELNKFARTVADRGDFRFVTVLGDAVFDAGMTAPEAKRFIEEQGVEYTVLYDRPESSSLIEKLGVLAVPWSFLLDDSGRVISDKATAGSDSAVMSAVEEHLGLAEEQGAVSPRGAAYDQQQMKPAPRKENKP